MAISHCCSGIFLCSVLNYVGYHLDDSDDEYQLHNADTANSGGINPNHTKLAITKIYGES